MKNFIAGQWLDFDQTIDVTNPYSGEVIDTVPKAGPAEVERALAALVDGARRMREMPAHERSDLLRVAAASLKQRAEEFARTISAEEGKPLAESRAEAARAVETISLSADEAKRLTGESFSLDAAPGGAGKIGFTLRVPCGIVAAITPFNYPLNLVCHKVGPAIAGGNAVLVKPASDTPLSALKLVEILLEAGLPEQAIACLTGPGSELGKAICSDDRVRKISFTGSDVVGEAICHAAGVKRVTMELGSNSPVIIMDDADLVAATAAIAKSGFSNAGQVCISTQRVYTGAKVHSEFVESLREQIADLVPADPLFEGTRLGPLVRESDAKRVAEWIDEAVAAGARRVVGGEREGARYPATILENTSPDMKVSREELFGPAVSVTQCSSIEEAIHRANDTRYGLAAGIFTQDIDRAMLFARDADAGVLNINGSSQFRVDMMPYGGLKQSGLGKEGPKYAIREMTEEKMVVWHPGA